MTDIAYDIELLQNVLIALEEGASDEKRAALETLKKMLVRKIELIERFERECA